MMADSPELRKEFEERVKSDATFAGERAARLNWWMERSKYDRKVRADIRAAGVGEERGERAVVADRGDGRVIGAQEKPKYEFMRFATRPSRNLPSAD
jgi:hypothetical protein